jgi:hypothetical protein
MGLLFTKIWSFFGNEGKIVSLPSVDVTETNPFTVFHTVMFEFHLLYDLDGSRYKMVNSKLL